MEIKKYKYLNNNQYKIVLDNNEIILYEDIIIKYKILLKKELSEKELNLYIKENEYFNNYYTALKYIKTRLRSKKEVKDYLLKNQVDEKDVLLIIERLENEGYINDNIFSKCYINDSINLRKDGPLKIINNLKKLGIDDEIINDEIIIFSDNLQKERIKKYIDKQLNLNKNKSLTNLKNKIIINLVNMGYEKKYIISYLDNISYNDDDIYQKEYDKIYNKLSKKYNGKELELKIKQKLYQKGFYKN